MPEGSHVNRDSSPGIFHSVNWGQASIEQRMAALQQLEHENAALMGRPERIVVARVIPSRMDGLGRKLVTRGLYSRGDPAHLTINSDLVAQAGDFARQSTGWLAAANVTHEGTHALQADVMNADARVDQQRLKQFSADIADADLMRRDLTSYANSGPDYFFRPSEWTARETASQRIAELHHQASGEFGRDPEFERLCATERFRREHELLQANDQFGTALSEAEMCDRIRSKIREQHPKARIGTGPATKSPDLASSGRVVDERHPIKGPAGVMPRPLTTQDLAQRPGPTAPARASRGGWQPGPPGTGRSR